jgi:hypothetical protein
MPVSAWYWYSLIASPPPRLQEFESLSVADLLGQHLYTQTLWKILVMQALYFGTIALVFRLSPKSGEKTQRGAGAWVSCMVHHTYVVILSLHSLHSQYSKGTVDIRGMLPGATWSLAYLLHDTLITAIPEARSGKGKHDLFLHHLLGLFLTVCTIWFYPAKLLFFAPHIWLCEASNFGLGLSWACQKFGLAESPLCRLGEYAFLAAFIATRIVNLPLVCFAATFVHYGLVGQEIQLCLWAVVAMQFFWLFKALNKFLCHRAAQEGKGD